MIILPSAELHRESEAKIKEGRGRGEWGMCEEGEREDNFYRVGFSSQGH